MAKTHWKKLTNPDYLGAYSIEDNQDLILTVGYVKNETVTGPDGKKEDCMVMHFKENVKPMILNATNAKMIAKLLKSQYIEDWAGHKIQIGISKVKAFGDVVEALRVRDKLPATTVIKCQNCGKPITGGYGMTSEQLAAYTEKQYGKKLCSACATAEKNKAAEQPAAEEVKE